MTKTAEKIQWSSPTGSRLTKQYKLKTDTTGNTRLVEVGETDTYAKIQSYEDECLIYNIIEHYQGNVAEAVTAASVNKGSLYMDITGAPKTLAEAQQKIIDAEQEFDKLPLNIRREYGMNANQWIAEAGTKDWYEKMGVKFENTRDTTGTVPNEPRGQDNAGGTETNKENKA